MTRVTFATYDDTPPLGGQGVMLQGMRAALEERGVDTATVSGRGEHAIRYPRVTGRARVVRTGSEVSVQPPVPIEVEVPDGLSPGPGLTGGIEAAIHSKLSFRAKVELIPEKAFGESGYKTRLTEKRP